MKHVNFSTTLNQVKIGAAATLFSVLALLACQDHKVPLPGQTAIRPTGPAPAYAPDISPQNLAIVEELGRLSPVPINQLTPQEARTKPFIKDAVNSLLDKNKIAPPVPNVARTQRTIPGFGGAPIRVVIYTPAGASSSAPVIVYMHGGGWVIANPELYEPSAVALSQNTGAVVVSVDYRLAPEFKFPTAHEDSYAAYKWVKENAASIGGNPNKVAIAGESAGGNMAVAVSMMARDRGVAQPIHILSVYPVANNDLNTPSYIKYANAMPLNRPLIEWFVDKYFRTMADGDHPFISLVDVADLRGLPPTTIIGAEIDPLQTEGMQLRDKLTSQLVPVAYQLFPGVTHEFFGTYAVERGAQNAQEFAAVRLREAFK